MTKKMQWAKMIYGVAVKVLEDRYLAEVATAMACVESGWGQKYPEHTNNILGIKPFRDQPYVLHRRSAIRIFESVEHCIQSWGYLARKSSLGGYVEARSHLKRLLGFIPKESLRLTKAAYTVFAKDFVRAYCPGNKMYPELVTQVLDEIRLHVGEEGAKCAGTHGPS